MELLLAILTTIVGILLFLNVFLSEEEIVKSAIISILLIILLPILFKTLSSYNYKQGQIDALKSKYNYEMKISYEKRLEYSIQDSIVIDSNGYRIGTDKNGNFKKFYYQSYYPDTIWETVFIPIDTQFVKK